MNTQTKSESEKHLNHVKKYNYSGYNMPSFIRALSMNTFNPIAFRQHFPCFSSLSTLGIYLDNAATTQLPDVVIDTLLDYARTGRSNVHRSSHQRANQLTEQFEQAREEIHQWLNAPSDGQIIWTSGTTMSLNLLANGLRQYVQKGQTVLVSALEHHANLVPWQQLCQQEQLQLEIIPVTPSGDLDLQLFEKQLQNNVALVAVAHVSNSLGSENDIHKICQLARQYNAFSIIDGAQAVAHKKINLTSVNCDAYVFSGHKMYGPNGIGVLYGSHSFLDVLTPSFYGGEMVDQVSYQQASFRELPFRLEAGTPNIAGALGLAATTDFLDQWGNGRIQYEQHLLNYTAQSLSQIEEVHIIANPTLRCAVLPFEVEGIHPFDITTWLNEQQIAIRCGHHCAIPVTEQFTKYGSIRLSIASYNTQHEIDQFITTLKQAIDINKL
ncbi:MAG: putative cysteine desulfurase [Candidatus Celerinatantimonas neptuna]|nr:MAG: putative cysteine desulfurase [Candidatus Celerinatantimonas neptuna]